MKHYYIRAEVQEGYPDYDFVIKAKNETTARIHARAILTQDYPDVFIGKYAENFSCEEVNGRQLLEIMTIS